MVRMKPGDWLTVFEAAPLLGVSPKRVYAIIKDGRLKPTKVGSVYLLLRSDVESFAKKPRTPGRPVKPAPKKPAKKGGKK